MSYARAAAPTTTAVRWPGYYRPMTQEQLVRIGFNVDDRPASLRRFLELLGPAYDALQSARSVRVDLTSAQFLGPAASVALVGLDLLAGLHGVTATFLPPAGPPALLGYLRFSGLEQRLFQGSPPDPAHPSSVTIPVARFTKPNIGIVVSPVVALVQRSLRIDEDGRLALEMCVNETMYNVHHHSGSRIGGVVAARYQSGATRHGLRRPVGEVRIAMLDHGDGIPTVVQRAHRELTDADAMTWATIAGNTTNPAGRNLGQGLSNLSMLTRSHGGSLFIFSGSIGATQQGDQRLSVTRLATAFPGTLVCCSLRIPQAQRDDGVRIG